MAIPMDRPTDLHTPALRQWWSVIAALLVVAIFSQAVFAGAMLSGIGWAGKAHALGAVLLIAAAVAASLVSHVTLRRIPHGPSFALSLSLLAAAVFLQTAIGKLSAHGANLMWVHVPLGVALVGLAIQALAGARRLGRAPR